MVLAVRVSIAPVLACTVEWSLYHPARTGDQWTMLRMMSKLCRAEAVMCSSDWVSEQ